MRSSFLHIWLIKSLLVHRSVLIYNKKSRKKESIMAGNYKNDEDVYKRQPLHRLVSDRVLVKVLLKFPVS